MRQTKIEAGEPFPLLDWLSVVGDRIGPVHASGWRLLIVYRGRHCPLCKQYLKGLDEMLDEFREAQIPVMVLSADPREKATADVADHGWRFPVGYGLSVPEMRQLGLYVSDPRSPEETDRQFAEPGLFVINPDGDLHIVDVSNAPFSRPDLRSLLKGILFVKQKGYPIRGRA